MTASRRSEIVTKAATERWAKTNEIRRAMHEGELALTDLKLACVLREDGARIFPERKISNALDGMVSRALPKPGDQTGLGFELAGAAVRP